jgi:hypothetical protein
MSAIQDWSVAEVWKYVESRTGFPQYKATFEGNNIDGKRLMRIHFNNLREMGICVFSDAKVNDCASIVLIVKIIMEAVKILQEIAKTGPVHLSSGALNSSHLWDDVLGDGGSSLEYEKLEAEVKSGEDHANQAGNDDDDIDNEIDSDSDGWNSNFVTDAEEEDEETGDQKSLLRSKKKSGRPRTPIPQDLQEGEAAEDVNADLMSVKEQAEKRLESVAKEIEDAQRIRSMKANTIAEEEEGGEGPEGDFLNVEQQEYLDDMDERPVAENAGVDTGEHEDTGDGDEVHATRTEEEPNQFSSAMDNNASDGSGAEGGEVRAEAGDVGEPSNDERAEE